MRIEEAYILVIEDDLNNLMITTEYLQTLGTKYVNARASGWQGLKLAERLTRVDLILLDLQLPAEDGYAVLQRIRAHPGLHATRVVALTANNTPEDEARARAVGFDGFIGKPLNFNRFKQQIAALLQGEVVWMPR
jgi:two-component system, cell cycle response regulator DivK